MPRSKGRTGTPFRRAQARCFAEETHCFFGDGYVDQTLPNYRSSRARSVHHLIPPDVAPHLAAKRENMRLAHIGCNASYGRGQYGTPSRTPRGRSRAGARTPRHVRARGALATAGVSNPERDW
jgi:hypothetical protein